jgi:hypothetical protein
LEREIDRGVVQIIVLAQHKVYRWIISRSLMLLPALSAIGQNDLTWKLLLNRDYPSWGYEIQAGATTMWERWNWLKCRKATSPQQERLAPAASMPSLPVRRFLLGSGHYALSGRLL